MVSDNELIQRFLSGDREAFDELVLRHRQRVYATACRMVGNVETAEEIAQETFIRAFKSLRKFRRKARFTTWLHRITMNLCYNELNRRRREISTIPETDIPIAESPEKEVAEKERKARLMRHIETLPFKQKSALVLRIFEELSFNEIGLAIGCSTGSAKVNYRHAILKLRDMLGRSGGDL